MIRPSIGHIVNFKDEDGGTHKAGMITSKGKGFNYEGRELTYYIIEDNGKKYKVFPKI